MNNNVEMIKETYRKGMRVRLISMSDSQSPPPGTKGTVEMVDDIGTIHIKWDNGSSLGLIMGEDEFEIVKPVVVNLFGAPGAGKSTGATYIFSKLKMAGINCEYISEFAKDKVWEQNQSVFDCQEYLFGKQSYKLQRIRNQVDVIVTDSPLPLSILYKDNPVLDVSFDNVVMRVFDSYNNVNYFVNRVKPYNPKGRLQTENESDALSRTLKKVLAELDIKYKNIKGDISDYDRVVEEIIRIVNQ